MTVQDTGMAHRSRSYASDILEGCVKKAGYAVHPSGRIAVELFRRYRAWEDADGLICARGYFKQEIAETTRRLGEMSIFVLAGL